MKKHFFLSSTKRFPEENGATKLEGGGGQIGYGGPNGTIVSPCVHPCVPCTLASHVVLTRLPGGMQGRQDKYSDEQNHSSWISQSRMILFLLSSILLLQVRSPYLCISFSLCDCIYFYLSLCFSVYTAVTNRSFISLFLTIPFFYANSLQQGFVCDNDVAFKIEKLARTDQVDSFHATKEPFFFCFSSSLSFTQYHSISPFVSVPFAIMTLL